MTKIDALNHRFEEAELPARLEALHSQDPMSFTAIQAVGEQLGFGPAEMGLLLETAELRHRTDEALTVQNVHDRMKDRWTFMTQYVEDGHTLEHKLNVLDGTWANRLNSVHSLCGAAGVCFQHALGVQEHCAGFSPVAAAPTCGASGAVPGTISGLASHNGTSVETQVAALAASGCVGLVGFSRGPVSGAQAGCGGEVGVAAGMSGAAAALMLGAKSWEVVDAAASLNMLNWTGVDCSPTGGYVEYPCAPRNGFAAAGAVLAAELALAGARPPYDVDYTFDVIFAVGAELSKHLRETEDGDWAETAIKQARPEDSCGKTPHGETCCQASSGM